jgi:hypothetical protein
MEKMRALFGYLSIGVLAVAAMGLVTVAGLGFAVGARPMAEKDAVIQHIDRTHKADRLDFQGTTVRSRSLPKQQIALPEGCEPVFSPLVTAGRTANISGRCLS